MNNCLNYSSAPFQFGMQNDARCYEDLNSSLCVATKPQQKYFKKYRLINILHMNPNVSADMTVRPLLLFDYQLIKLQHCQTDHSLCVWAGNWSGGTQQVSSYRSGMTD